VNSPAIAFYRRQGFTLCGLDLSLYDPAGSAPGEAALYFVLPLESTIMPTAVRMEQK
jgi:ribosomal protein S18 acetylase RimI-like enzyme